MNNSGIYAEDWNPNTPPTTDEGEERKPSMLNELKDLIQSIKGNSILSFDDPVKIKVTPHSIIPFFIHGVCVSGNAIIVIEGDGSGNSLEEKDKEIIATLFQRIKLIQSKHAA